MKIEPIANDPVFIGTLKTGTEFRRTLAGAGHHTRNAAASFPGMEVALRAHAIISSAFAQTHRLVAITRLIARRSTVPIDHRLL